MEEKNLALLGFVSKAADYLKDNLSDDSLEIKELKEVDLDKIKSELSNKIGNSFNVGNSNEDLINAGKEAFDSFISKNVNMIDEFKGIFDDNFKEENNNKDDEVIDHLMKILKDPDEEASVEDEYVNIISNAINTKEDDNPNTVEVYKDVKQDEEIDSIFSEILANESIIDDFVSNDTVKEEAKDDEEHISMSSNEFKQILEDVLGDVYKEINRSNDQIIEKFKDIEKELENQKSIFENKSNDNEDNDKHESLSQVLSNVKNVNSSEHDDVVKDYFKNLNESFNEEKEDEDLNPFVTVDDINDLEEDNKEDIVEAKQEEVAELDKEENSPFVSLFDKDYLDDYDKRSLEEKYIINPCANKLEEQEKAKALEEESLRKEEEEAFKEDISSELDNIFSDLLYEDDVVNDNPIDNNQEEATLEEEYEPLLNQDYIDDYNNRSLDEIYIANPCLDYLEKQDSLNNEEDAEVTDEEVDVDRLKQEAIEQLEKELFTSEQLDVLEKQYEEIKAEETEELDCKSLAKEYIDDYNNRSLEDIYIANPGAIVDEDPSEKQEDTIETSNEVTDDFLNIGEEFEPTKEDEETLNREYIEDYNKRSIDDIYIANPGAEEEKEDIEEASEDIVIEEPKDKDAVSELLNDYDQNVAADIEDKLNKQEELKKEIYNSIKSIYPYLSNGFIKGVYDLKDSLSNEYKDGEEIIILHRLVFKDVVGLRKFVDIIMSHDYLVNVDEKQMIVDTFKEHINSDGKILTDIFEVANQAKLLTGEYEGYRIIEKNA